MGCTLVILSHGSYKYQLMTALSRNFDIPAPNPPEKHASSASTDTLRKVFRYLGKGEIMSVMSYFCLSPKTTMG